jgi:hypothetical protein
MGSQVRSPIYTEIGVRLCTMQAVAGTTIFVQCHPPSINVYTSLLSFTTQKQPSNVDSLLSGAGNSPSTNISVYPQRSRPAHGVTQPHVECNSEVRYGCARGVFNQRSHRR